MMNAIRSTIKNLRDWIADILDATKEVLAEHEAEQQNVSPNLATLLRDYLNLRKAERSEWSRYGQQKGTTDDLKAISSAELEKAVNDRWISSRTMRTAKSRTGDRLIAGKDATAWVCYLRN